MNMTVEPRSKSISLPSKLSLKDEDQTKENIPNINEIHDNDKKASRMSTTETTTLHNSNKKSSIKIKREIYNSQNFGHKSIQSNSSTQEIENLSQLGVAKDADIVVNISQLDLDRSVIGEYRNGTDSDMLDSTKRFGSEMSFDKVSDNNKDKVDLIKKKEEEKDDDSSIYKWIIVFIFIMVIVTAIVFFINKYLM